MGPRTAVPPTGQARCLPRATAIGAGVAALLLSVGSSAPGLTRATTEPADVSRHATADAGHLEVRLSADGPRVSEMVATVRHHARRTLGAHPDAPVEVVLTTDLAGEADHDHAMLAGVQVGSTAFVRTDVAWPERTLLHEVAHLLAPGDEHGPIWRAIYLGAIEELFGQTRRAQEQRRLAWVYDRCYRNDGCQLRTDRDG
jgi:hypothetical protein